MTTKPSTADVAVRKEGASEAQVPTHPASPDPHIEAAVTDKKHKEGEVAAAVTELPASEPAVKTPPQSKIPAAVPGKPAAATGATTLTARFRNLLTTVRQAPNKLYTALMQKQPTIQKAAKDTTHATAPATAGTTTGTGPSQAHQEAQKEAQVEADKSATEKAAFGGKVVKAEGPKPVAGAEQQPQEKSVATAHEAVKT